MLIEFSVANYRSFRDEVTLSMVASPLKTGSGEPDRRNQFAAPGDINLLTSAAIYGANASGKSNLVAAMNFMRHFVITSSNIRDENEGIDVEPFRLSTETDTQPSSFEVVFIINEQHFRYGFEVKENLIVTEWLHLAKTCQGEKSLDLDDKEVILFEREGEEIGLDKSFEEEGRDLVARTRPDALFLSVCAQFKGKASQELLEWFQSLRITTGLSPMDHNMRLFTEARLNNADSAEDIKSFVRQLDLGIEDILIEKDIFSVPDLLPLPDEPPDELIKLHGALENARMQFGKLAELFQMEESAVRTVHHKLDGKGHPISTELFYMDRHESEGTKKLFALSGPLVNALNQGDLLIIDEMDARLHPVLTQEIVNRFNDPNTNTEGAQLVFTTQDTNLLDHRLLRRDQIWFTEKDRQGASHLYSLIEFKIENDAPFKNDYIQGRYGAIPFLGRVRQLFLEQE